MTEENDVNRLLVPIEASEGDAIAERLRDFYAQLPRHVVGGVEYHRIEATKSYLTHMCAIRDALAPYGLFKEWCLTARINYWALTKALSRAFGDVAADTRLSHARQAIDAASTDRLLRWWLHDPDNSEDPEGYERFSDAQLEERNRRDARKGLYWGWWQVRVRQRIGKKAYDEVWTRTLRVYARAYLRDRDDDKPLTLEEATAIVDQQHAYMDVERDEAEAAGLPKITEDDPTLHAAIEAALTPDRVRRLALALAQFQSLEWRLTMPDDENA